MIMLIHSSLRPDRVGKLAVAGTATQYIQKYLAPQFIAELFSRFL